MCTRARVHECVWASLLYVYIYLCYMCSRLHDSFPEELSVLMRLRLGQRWSEETPLLVILGQEGEELFQLKVGPRLFTVVSAWEQHYE